MRNTWQLTNTETATKHLFLQRRDLKNFKMKSVAAEASNIYTLWLSLKKKINLFTHLSCFSIPQAASNTENQEISRGVIPRNTVTVSHHAPLSPAATNYSIQRRGHIWLALALRQHRSSSIELPESFPSLALHSVNR